MAKAFISILGTNDYLEAHHKLNNQISSEADKYVQEFLVKKLCKTWSKDDEVRVFLTEESEKNNWNDNGHKDRSTGQPKNNFGLKSRLNNLGINPKIISQKIPTGNNQEELWQIFDIISSSFKKNDYVIIDITHSFRFLPLLLTVILNYVKQIESIHISGIYYAAFESLGSFQEIEKLSLEKRIVPILDLTPIVELQEWTLATYNYVNHAEIKELRSLVGKKKINIKERNTENRDSQTLEILKDTVNKLNVISNNIAFCRGKDIIDFDYKKVKSELKILENENLTVKPVEKLFGIINKKIEGFKDNNINNGFIATNWALDHNLFQQAITILQETIISKILVDIGYDYKETPFEKRKIVGYAIEGHSLPPQNKSKKEIELYNEVQSLNKAIAIRRDYRELKKLRNDINHAGFDKKSKHYVVIKEKISGLSEKIKKVMV